MKSIILSVVFLLSASGVFAQKSNDTFSVHFGLDIDALDDHAQLTIDSLFYIGKLKPGVPVSIIGYTDYLATDEYNLDLSRRRAENVKGYLVKAGLNEQSIRLLLGKGEIKRTDTLRKIRGIPQDRRVDIVMEYVKRPTAKRTSGDTVITMHPGDKLIIPPSSDDPGFDINNIPKGRTFILKNIYFPMGRHFPKQDSYTDLTMLLDAMKENLGLVIRIEGHVCCITNVPDALDLDSHELDLSVNRARFIYEYLKARGVSQNRLSFAGYGKTRPIYEDEQTEAEAAANRRVEIRILDK